MAVRGVFAGAGEPAGASDDVPDDCSEAGGKEAGGMEAEMAAGASSVGRSIAGLVAADLGSPGAGAGAG